MASRNSYSIVEFSNENQGYKCGYCKSKNTNFSHGMWAHQLSVHDYQDLIDRGWRRSGHYCYKPTMWKMCCPSYTIRCDATNFKISKSQKKILKRMNRFLAFGERGKPRANLENNDNNGENRDVHELGGSATDVVEAHLAQGKMPSTAISPVLQNIIVSDSINLSKPSTSSMRMEEIPSDPKELSKTDTPSQVVSSLNVPKHSEFLKKSPKSGEGADKGKPPCKKAKVIRLERKQLKQNKQGLSLPSTTHKPKHDNSPKSLEDFLDYEFSESPSHRLQVRLVRSQPPSADFNSSFKESHSLYRRYQMTVHGDPESKCTESQYRRFLVRSPLELKLVALMSREFANTFDQSWQLYAKYQKAVHGETDEECDLSSYVDFLVQSPIKALRPADGSGPPQGYGSFHHQYWLDDKLIAVGVLDILPRCVSSVYFYYDPDYSDLTLGTYGSLREVALTRTLSHSVPDLKWYCMGFYIHSCPKMRYKAGLSPSMLLCPESLTWHPIESCLPLLDKKKYSRLNPDETAVESDSIININQVSVLYEQCAMDFGHYCQLKGHVSDAEKSVITQYAKLVGKKCARRMLLFQQRRNM